MLGIIGGSGLYSLEGLNVLDSLRLRTPFGEPSSDIKVGEYRGVKVAFLARHGEGHIYPPHLVPYRANLWALRELGVDRVLSISAVGSINRKLRAGDFLIVDSFIEFTKNREHTFYEGVYSKEVEGEDKVAELIREKRVVHIDVSEPYCPQMRSVLRDILEGLRLPFSYGGVYACTEGPRFESTAEIRMLGVLGADVVGMTGYPEVVLARELTMCYATLCVVANPAAGISENGLTSEEVIELMKSREEDIGRIVKEFICSLPGERDCGCGDVLEGAEV
jgi:5'-methylthioadenosine phosphorylase